MKNRAFKKYMASLSPEEFNSHLSSCLASGGEMAFDLMAEANGDWQVEPGPKYIQLLTNCREFIKKQIEQHDENSNKN